MIEMASDTNRKIKQNQLGVSAAEGSIASLRQETESAANDFPLNTFVFSREDAQGGGFGSVQTAAWKVKIDYQTVDGKPVGKVSIYNPVLYSSGARISITNASVADWNDISDLVKLPLPDGGTLVCRIKMGITKSTDSNGEESVRKWIHDASLFFLTGESSEEEPEDEEWHDIAICTFFAGADAIMPFKQLHTGALTFTGEIVAGGGGAINPEDFNIYITKIGEEVWLTQGQESETTATETTYSPKRKVLRLDNIIKSMLKTSGATDDPYEMDATRSLVSRKYDWVGVGAAGSIEISPQVSADATKDSAVLTFTERNVFVTDHGQGAKSLKYTRAFVLDPDENAMQYASIQSIPYLTQIGYKMPADETEAGELYSLHGTLSVLATSAPVIGGQQTIFYTEVQDANDGCTYGAAEEGGCSSGGGCNG